MIFDVGFELSRQAGEQIITELRNSVPSLANMSREEIARRASKDAILAAMARLRNFTPVSKVSHLVDNALVMDFDQAVMRTGLMVPISKNEHRLTIAIADPYNSAGIDYCKRKFPLELVVILTHTSEVNLILERRTDFAEITDAELKNVEVTERKSEVKEFDIGTESGDSVVRHVQAIVSRGLQFRASDIHFNVEKDAFYYAYRIDGDVTERINIDIKLMSRIDSLLTTTAGHPSESRNNGLPLSGRFTVSTGNRRVAVRFERVPTYRGFHITLRLLDKSHINAKLGEGALALDPVTMGYLRKIMDMPDGIVVMSGATGSGKSTTLTAVLKELNFTKYNIMTLENPVEEEVKGITHVNLEDMSQCPAFIASLMRSDPDIILIGEVRDKASAELAVEAAITGHQVFTTIHTSKASLIIARFMQLGVEKWKIAETLRGACAQRLVRTLCPSCKRPHKITADEVARFQLTEEFVGLESFSSVEGGCDNCNKSGYRGRRAILEVLPITEEISDLIMEPNITANKIGKYVREKLKIPSLKDSGLNLLRSGDADLNVLKDVIALGLD